MFHKKARLLLVAIQAIPGWEWLMSGGNKLLAGTFPQGPGGYHRFPVEKPTRMAGMCRSCSR